MQRPEYFLLAVSLLQHLRDLPPGSPEDHAGRPSLNLSLS
jgi:hypothetical protein